MNKADLAKKPEAVAAMFDSVAKSYDRTNDLLSFGQDRIWRKKVLKEVDPKPGQVVLDLAAGTGSSSIVFLKPGVRVIASDFSNGMLEVGRQRHPELEFVFADAMKLPFENNSMDAVTISFGLRNVEKPKVALQEMLRVLKPGGKVVICEFSRVTFPVIRNLYEFYLKKVLPRLSSLLAKNSAAYDYLADSILAWPNQQQLASWLTDAGFTDVNYKNASLGVVAIHSAKKGSK
ncbi:MAG: bifunctional demethylmenaquinone methyltransferase/2-methoxy-6-polyprenyl-1,4-benzoquinol methylase UbiE [Actinobacteria bacterium]|nr:bifunctional demethylmenaquinone methyltransferase/2-methoxy-6-polyprenyl-1,4-benzoquinol methylase UbiE [Actinomycetota bacterium]